MWQTIHTELLLFEFRDEGSTCYCHFLKIRFVLSCSVSSHELIQKRVRLVLFKDHCHFVFKETCIERAWVRNVGSEPI